MDDMTKLKYSITVTFALMITTIILTYGFAAVEQDYANNYYYNLTPEEQATITAWNDAELAFYEELYDNLDYVEQATMTKWFYDAPNIPYTILGAVMILTVIGGFYITWKVWKLEYVVEVPRRE